MARLEAITRLRAELARFHESGNALRQPRVSIGISALDALLPQGGVRPGSLIEWISTGDGGGATTLVLQASAAAISGGRPLVVIDPQGEFYPPSFGMSLTHQHDLKRPPALVIRPANSAESVWAMEQVLRCAPVGVMLGWADRLSDRAARRLQLAAERGACAGMLIRPGCDERAPFWAEARFLVEPIASAGSRRLRVSLVRCRGGEGGASLNLELDDETGAVRVVPEMAYPVSIPRSARA